MFKITMGRGFHITFSNGYTISCQFGYSHYCQNRGAPNTKGTSSASSPDCEIAIWDSSDRWITGEVLEHLGMESSEPMIQGYVKPDEVGKIIAHLVNL